jgi:T5orf172 domain
VIYFARLMTGHIKIGHTVNLATRMRNLSQRKGGREVIYVIGVQEGDQNTERELHHEFDCLRVAAPSVVRDAEDFRLGPQLFAHILAICRPSPEVQIANDSLMKLWLLRQRDYSTPLLPL